jgi:hypothetical protein
MRSPTTSSDLQAAPDIGGTQPLPRGAARRGDPIRHRATSGQQRPHDRARANPGHHRRGAWARPGRCRRATVSPGQLRPPNTGCGPEGRGFESPRTPQDHRRSVGPCGPKSPRHNYAHLSSVPPTSGGAPGPRRRVHGACPPWTAPRPVCAVLVRRIGVTPGTGPVGSAVGRRSCGCPRRGRRAPVRALFPVEESLPPVVVPGKPFESAGIPCGGSVGR